jgi:hypothetical protein
MTMSFWVLENDKGGYAKIHLETCHTCNRKYGLKPGNNGSGFNHSTNHNGNRRWTGPFSSFEEAMIWAKEVRKHVDVCKFCISKMN